MTRRSVESPGICSCLCCYNYISLWLTPKLRIRQLVIYLIPSFELWDPLSWSTSGEINCCSCWRNLKTVLFRILAPLDSITCFISSKGWFGGWNWYFFLDLSTVSSPLSFHWARRGTPVVDVFRFSYVSGLISNRGAWWCPHSERGWVIYSWFLQIPWCFSSPQRIWCSCLSFVWILWCAFCSYEFPLRLDRLIACWGFEESSCCKAVDRSSTALVYAVGADRDTPAACFCWTILCPSVSCPFRLETSRSIFFRRVCRWVRK